MSTQYEYNPSVNSSPRLQNMHKERKKDQQPMLSMSVIMLLQRLSHSIMKSQQIDKLLVYIQGCMPPLYPHAGDFGVVPLNRKGNRP